MMIAILLEKLKFLIKLPVFIAMIFLSCSSSSDDQMDDTSNYCRDTNCANYTSREAAQAAYDADPECRGDLDADNDGLACEEQGNTVKTCSSTSNCGCSNKNKTPCQSDPCCKWVVGEGCSCN